MPTIQTFTPAEIASFRKAGKILRECLTYTASLVKPGVLTKDLDTAAEAFIRKHGGIPAFKGYSGFPATLCTSINEECVHGMPGLRVLKDGDILSIDCGVIVDGLYTDACITVPVGNISPAAQKLLTVTEQALEAAVHILRAGITVGDLSSTIQSIVERAGFKCIPSLTGHGLGRTLHQFPDIPNVGKAGAGAKFPVNTVIAVEPIVSVGSASVVEGSDGWTIATKDKSLSAHFEHTLLVTEDGCEILA